MSYRAALIVAFSEVERSTSRIGIPRGLRLEESRNAVGGCASDKQSRRGCCYKWRQTPVRKTKDLADQRHDDNGSDECHHRPSEVSDHAIRLRHRWPRCGHAPGTTCFITCRRASGWTGLTNHPVAPAAFASMRFVCCDSVVTISTGINRRPA